MLRLPVCGGLNDVHTWVECGCVLWPRTVCVYVRFRSLDAHNYICMCQTYTTYGISFLCSQYLILLHVVIRHSVVALQPRPAPGDAVGLGDGGISRGIRAEFPTESPQVESERRERLETFR